MADQKEKLHLSRQKEIEEVFAKLGIAHQEERDRILRLAHPDGKCENATPDFRTELNSTSDSI